MSTINNSGVVKEQYKDSSNLNTRISIHSKYSVNKQGFGNWIISNYKLKDGARVLELGCGTGDIWKNHLGMLENISELILTDFSEGMIKTTKETLGENDKLTYKLVDIQNIPFQDESFDIVIANMMLYHVPDLAKGLLEVKRVLKADGAFYCATFGENGIIQYLSSLLKDYGVEDTVNKNFTLQNGEEKLGTYFKEVTKLYYEDALEVTDIDDIVDYIYSLSSMTELSSAKRQDIKKNLEGHMKNGVLRVPKEYGMFACGK